MGVRLEQGPGREKVRALETQGLPLLPGAGAEGEGSVETVAHTKRSRTQVYSGKKTSSGPQGMEQPLNDFSLPSSPSLSLLFPPSISVVTSLFDLSMKILIDNIDG